MALRSFFISSCDNFELGHAGTIVVQSQGGPEDSASRSGTGNLFRHRVFLG